MTVSRTFLRRLEQRVKALEARIDPPPDPLDDMTIIFFDKDNITKSMPASELLAQKEARRQKPNRPSKEDKTET